MADCRRLESDSDCTLTIIGDEDEVVRAAAGHAVAVHGHTDSPEGARPGVGAGCRRARPVMRRGAAGVRRPAVEGLRRG